MHNQLDPSDPGGHSLKKSILWNAVEPGDPYDIKKSMIAKLPGERKVFLGNKLELVCLLQAAEIERLALNLEEFKAKLREIEKSGLDRHSYEIQIKQLAARLQGEEVLRAENSKLKNFIDRLNQELEEARQKLSSGSSQMNSKYQQALQQVQLSSDQNAHLSSEVANLRALLESRTGQLSSHEVAVRQSQRREQELQCRLEALEQSEEERVGEYEDKFTLLGKEIQRLNAVLKAKTDQADQAKYYLRSKLEENEFLISNQIKLSEEVSALKAGVGRSLKREEEERARSYEERVSNYEKEVAHLKSQISGERVQAGRELEEARGELDRLRGAVGELEGSLREAETQNEKYESNSSIIGREIERLNAVLKGKVDEASTQQVRVNRLTEENQFYLGRVRELEREAGTLKQIHQRMEELEFELGREVAAKERLAKANEDLLRQQAEFDHSKLDSYQMQVSQLIQERNRLSDGLSSLQLENRTLRERSSASETVHEELRRASRELADIKALMLQEDVSKRNTQERLAEQTRKSTEFQKLINELSGEVQRLNEILRAKLQEVSILENKVQFLGGERQRLEGELHGQGGKDAKLEDYENKFALISLEVERLNSNLKVKLQQTLDLEQQLALLRKDVQRLKDTLEEAREKCGGLQSENDILRSQVREARSKQKEVADLERLNNLLRLKVEEAARWESSNHQLILTADNLQAALEASQRENGEQRAKLLELREENITMIGQLTQYKEKVQQILQQFQRLQQMLESFRGENSELKQQVFQLRQQLKVQGTGGNLREKNQKLLEEIERLKRVEEQLKEDIKQLRLILSQDHSFEKRIREQLSLIVILCAEIETLRKRVEEKEREVEDVRRESLVPLKA